MDIFDISKACYAYVTFWKRFLVIYITGVTTLYNYSNIIFERDLTLDLRPANPSMYLYSINPPLVLNVLRSQLSL